MLHKRQSTIYLTEENDKFIKDACNDLGINRNGYINMLIHNLIKNAENG